MEDALDAEPGDVRVRDLALDAIDRLLRSGKLIVGVLVPPGELVATGENPERAVERIRKEVLTLGREPGVGEVAWFRIP